MKKNSIKLLVFLMLLTLAGQESFAQKAKKASTEKAEISFTEGKWNDILALAKKTNKHIFVDGYAVWCGPCKLLKAKTFKEAHAASYFNDNFINYAINLEAGEGVKLADQWEVQGYPVLIFVSPEGKLILKQEGFVVGDGLIEMG